MKRGLLLGALVLGSVVPAAPVVAATPQALDAKGVPALVAVPAKGSKVVALWSLDCAYCEENLAALRAYQRQHPDVDLIYVATDPVRQGEALEARLKHAKLDDVPARAYADATPDRLNFLIDPSWGGETPRTLVVHADGSRQAYSGALTPERIATLLHQSKP
ncbi:TlpA family protein disulfide reductase [Luteibacter aegosomatissinici]|uniref:TlpA family protein disulfide reductase n=1 Tax=Luteibacter aegosomatissinici TaxID=2911539 RepID=UPI001FF76DB7|nr:hypothetical protein [Luteibacter aegosomatissinici]UPG93414.1 hypothetical protein L2Y97_16400 [Luteibacter aegosomatissinici]